MAVQKKPNILILWGDDIGIWNISHFSRGMMGYQTPNIDRIAAEGVTFTDYVARARVEKTKQLLLNPNVRVSEAAYEAGFQSLSQFNRVFRRVEGQSPSAYREHLHGTTGASLAFAA